MDGHDKIWKVYFAICEHNPKKYEKQYRLDILRFSLTLLMKTINFTKYEKKYAPSNCSLNGYGAQDAGDIIFFYLVPQ